MAQAVWSPKSLRPFSLSGHPFEICDGQGGTGVHFSLVHPALVLRPSCFPENLGVNKKLYSLQK